MKANLEATLVFVGSEESIRVERVIDIPFVPHIGMNLSFPATARWSEDLGDHMFTVDGVSWDSATGELWILFEDEHETGFDPRMLADEFREAGWRIAWSSVPQVAACGAVVTGVVVTVG